MLTQQFPGQQMRPNNISTVPWRVLSRSKPRSTDLFGHILVNDADDHDDHDDGHAHAHDEV